MLVCLSVLTVLVAIQISGSADAISDTPAAPISLNLKVALDDIYNHKFEVSLPVKVGAPFKVVTTNGSVTTTISGTLGDPVNGQYALPLTVSEWESKTDNVTDTTNYKLELGKAEGAGPVASIIFLRTVVLTDSAAQGDTR
jgi:hypothetical protein